MVSSFFTCFREGEEEGVREGRSEGERGRGRERWREGERGRDGINDIIEVTVKKAKSSPTHRLGGVRSEGCLVRGEG